MSCRWHVPFYYLDSVSQHGMTSRESGTAIILDPSVAGTDDSYDDTSNTWTATFSYGIVSGVATCNSTQGTNSIAYPQYNFDTGTTGANCWCRMLTPARSAWVHESESSSYNCSNNCAYNCGHFFHTDVYFRIAIITTAGQ